MVEYNQFDFNPGGRKKVIFSIDGGGMRGTIVVAMLAELELVMGKPVYEMVDFVGGTSTGAIIAAAFGLHISATDLLEIVYKDRLPKAIGSRGLGVWLRFIRNGFRYFYDLEIIVNALKSLAEGKRVRDLQSPAVLLTAKDLHTSNTYFIVSTGPGAEAFSDWPVTAAVAASGAAPIYFPSVIHRLVDGGVGVFGNPSLATATEAMEYIKGGFADHNVIHISFGTGYTPNVAPPDRVRGWTVINWIEYVIGEGMEDAALQQAMITRGIYADRTDFRRYNPLLTRDNIEHVLGVPTGRIDPMYLGLDSTDPEAIDLMEKIGRAYAHKIDWRKSRTIHDLPDEFPHDKTPGIMPWHTVGGRPAPTIQPVDFAGSIFDV